jgi:hypothetical protein
MGHGGGKVRGDCVPPMRTALSLGRSVHYRQPMPLLVTLPFGLPSADPTRPFQPTE